MKYTYTVYEWSKVKQAANTYAYDAMGLILDDPCLEIYDNNLPKMVKDCLCHWATLFFRSDKQEIDYLKGKEAPWAGDIRVFPIIRGCIDVLADANTQLSVEGIIGTGSGLSRREL